MRYSNILFVKLTFDLAISLVWKIFVSPQKICLIITVEVTIF